MPTEGLRKRKIYMIGGGVGSLAAAVFAIRDAGVRGGDITIFEAQSSLGGSLDAAGDADHGYAMRGSRMMTAENFECTWELLKTIPSLTSPGKSVFEETIEFSDRNRWSAKARLIDRNRALVDVSSMGFSMRDRFELLRLNVANETELEDMCITDWMSPDFFRTNFWLMWQTTFAFQPWHSALEFRRYMHRFIRSFSRIDTMSGVKHPVYNHFDSFIRPIVAWLVGAGVIFKTNVLVTDLDLAQNTDNRIYVKKIHCKHLEEKKFIDIENDDLVILQNGSMTDASRFGSMTRPPEQVAHESGGGWALWEKLAKRSPEFGRPETFNSSKRETSWMSFTITLRDKNFFTQMERLTGNAAGSGGLVTFKDAHWLMTILLYHQPHFIDQPDNVQVFWGYALHPDRIGDFVAKPMTQCSGREILRELCGHLNFDENVFESATCIPCLMPYITSQFMPRKRGDRPLPVPKCSGNFAFVSQFVEIDEDVVFTIEYSIRAAQIAVYSLLDVDRPIPPVSRHDKSVGAQIHALVKSFQ